MRGAPTRAETALWKHIRKLDGFHFRRQLALGDYVFDFGDHNSRLLIEVDGGVHDAPDVAARDDAKEAWATSQGYGVVRIENAIALNEPELAIALIRERARNAAAPHPRPLPTRGRGDSLDETQ